MLSASLIQTYEMANLCGHSGVGKLLLGEEWITLAQVRAFKCNFTDAGHPNGGTAHHRMVSKTFQTMNQLAAMVVHGLEVAM
jgi:hypothetical protein